MSHEEEPPLTDEEKAKAAKFALRALLFTIGGPLVAGSVLGGMGMHPVDWPMFDDDHRGYTFWVGFTFLLPAIMMGKKPPTSDDV